MQGEEAEAMQVNDAMAESVRGLHATASLGEAIAAMLSSDAGALSIFEDDHSLVGIVTEGDLQEHPGLIAEKHRPLWLELLLGEEKRAVAHVGANSPSFLEIRTHGVTSCAETVTLRAAVDLMKRSNIKRLPMMVGDRVVGMLVGVDLLGVMAILTSAPHHSANHAEIRSSILAALHPRA
jgi:CBS domain-containing protein